MNKMKTQYKIKLRPGDHCRRDMGEEKYRECVQRFFEDGMPESGEGVGSWARWPYFGWHEDNDSGLTHSHCDADDSDSFFYQGRLLTHAEIMETEPCSLQYDPDDVAFKPRTKEQSAIKTLESKGYEWRGGEYWAPPLGDKPEWLEWSGDRLPPVGTVCEASMDFDRGKDGTNWNKIEVLYSDESTVVGRIIEGAHYPEYSNGFETNLYQFRPLKSPRDRWVEEACKKLDDKVAKYNVNIDCSHAIRVTIEAIYDAGLAKEIDQ